MTTCSIIVPVHNRASLTIQCLDTLLKSSPRDVSSEIVVVDDASSDSTSQVLAERSGDVAVVRHERNRGFATSCNDGAAVAQADWLVFLNNDTLPQPGWLEALLRYASVRKQIGLVGAKLLFPNDTIQHAGVVFGRELTPHHVYLGFPSDHAVVNTSREFQVVTGACALIRRALFEELGGFDSAFLNGYEDVDLCLRLRRAELEVHYCHESVVYHLESATRSFGTNQRNHELFLERWSSFAYQDDFDYYVKDGLIDISYPMQFPALLWVSPHLAVLDRERRTATEKLLAERSRQVFEAQKEIVRLNLHLLESGVDRGRGDTRI